MAEANNFSVKIKNLVFAYPNKPESKILDNASLAIKKSEIVCLVGENGCGKTTLISLIAGFLPPNSGTISFGGKRSFATVVFQQLGLLEWKTAQQNIELALLSSSMRASKKEKIVQDCLRVCKLEKEKDKLPKELSGGMKQRVAIARALCAQPALLLLDEPFSSLDSETRKELQEDIFRIARKTKTSIILVTHHLNEVLKQADRTLVLENGKIYSAQKKGKIFIRRQE